MDGSKAFDSRKAFQLAEKNKTKQTLWRPSVFMSISDMVCRPAGPIRASYCEQQPDSFVYLLHGLSMQSITHCTWETGCWLVIYCDAMKPVGKLIRRFPLGHMLLLTQNIRCSFSLTSRLDCIENTKRECAQVVVLHQEAVMMRLITSHASRSHPSRVSAGDSGLRNSQADAAKADASNERVIMWVGGAQHLPWAIWREVFTPSGERTPLLWLRAAAGCRDETVAFWRQSCPSCQCNFIMRAGWNMSWWFVEQFKLNHLREDSERFLFVGSQNGILSLNPPRPI